MSVGEYEASLRSKAAAARRRLFGGRAPIAPPAAKELPKPVAVMVRKAKRVSLVERMLRAQFPRHAVSTAVMTISKAHDVAPILVAGRCRTREVVAARNEVFDRLWTSGLSIERIGRAFGKDHTTVMHGIRRHRGESAVEIKLRKFAGSKRKSRASTEETVG